MVVGRATKRIIVVAEYMLLLMMLSEKELL